MDFISNQQPQIDEMLSVLGLKSVEELWKDIPKHLWKNAPRIDDGLSEYEGRTLIESVSKENTYASFDNYLGAGAYEHYVPALVQAMTGKSEFLTSYTPYQAECSQGMLQAIFEFQTAVCALTGLDAANASLYDGASACAEALLMAVRLQPERREVVIGNAIHPHYLEVIYQYLAVHDVKIEAVPYGEEIEREAFQQALSNKTCAVLLQYPNFLGIIDPIKDLFAESKSRGALNIVCANPLAYGLYASASELGADIAVGDMQPFGLGLNFGGPYAGYIACRQDYVRCLPGRVAGMTTDHQGNQGFVLTLQAREQHIRREKATSNICTNQALASLASLVTLLWYGKGGIKKLALTNYQRAAYLKKHLALLPGVKKISQQPCLNEFIVEFSAPIERVLSIFRQNRIEPGVPLARYDPGRANQLLIAVTETKSKTQLDHYLKIASLIS